MRPPQQTSMTTATLRVRAANVVLNGSAAFWFATALIGQWAFFYYIAAFYGTPTLWGNFHDWNKNNFLFKGYVASDTTGNLFFAAHILLAALVTFGGTLQLIAQIRARTAFMHRWNGRLFLLAAMAASIGGLYLVWVRGSSPNVFAAVAITLNATLIMVFAALAWRSALASTYSTHRNRALRAFVAANGLWFQRVGFFAWIVVNDGPAGMTEHLDGPFDRFWVFGYYLLPLAFLELYLHAKDRAGPRARFATAVRLTMFTALPGTGIFGAYMFMWRPLPGRD